MDPLFCNSCNRPFSSVPALERHRLRCRYRPRSRKKACSECSRSKVRCDQGTPTCSRCAVHALACSYPNAGLLAPDQPHQARVPPGLRDASLPLTPSSDLSQSNSGWTPELHLVDQTALFAAQGWIPDGDVDWQFEPLPVSHDAHVSAGHSSAGPSGSEADTKLLPAPNQSSDSFRDLTIYLSERMQSAEQGLDFIDCTLKGYMDGFASGAYRPHFIHFKHWDVSGRPLALVEAAVVAQLYAARMPHSHTLLLRSIGTQLLQTQRTLPKHDRPDDLATLQTAVLYAGMRIYRAGGTSSECIDRIPLRLMQHVLSKNLYYMTPISNPNPEDWEAWILEESTRRSFFTLHALDYVTHARQSLPNALCALFPDCPLPCPSHIWEATTADEWAVRYRAWEAYCNGGSGAGPLRSRDVFAWVQGRTTGREEQVLVWFKGVGEELGRLIFECLRAQARTEGIEALL